MGAGVEATCRGVETDFWKKKLEEFLLIGTGVVASKCFTGGWLRQGESFFGNGDESWAEFSKKSCYVFSEPSRLVALKKGILGLVGVAPEVSHLAGE